MFKQRKQKNTMYRSFYFSKEDFHINTYIANYFQGLNMTSKRTEKQECVLTTETESIRTEYYR